MAGIDSRIVVIGLPQVASALGADTEQAIWFTQAYTLGSTISLLFIGRISDIFGRVRVYTLGFTIFTIGSALTRLSLAPQHVIAFRFVQGLGAAVLFTNSAAIITDATPRSELGLSLGVNQIAFRVGAMVGLTLSGLILTLLDWRALFYINVPVGVFGTLWAHRRLKEVPRPERRPPMDWVGFVTFTVAITSFLLSLTFAAYGRGEYAVVLGLVVTASAAFSIFVYRERRVEHPLLDLRLLRIREFTGGVLAMLLSAISWGAVLLLLSLYFQLVRGLAPFQAGLAILPFDVAFLAVGPISGKLSDKYGHVAFTTTGLALISISLYLLSTTDATTPYVRLAADLVIYGVGIGLFTSPNLSSIMGSVPMDRRGIASGLRATFFNVGFAMSFNLAILIMTFSLPYSVITSTISSPNPPAVSQAERILFANGLHNAYFWLALLNGVAIVPSLLRGKRVTEEKFVEAVPTY
jgi:EmrB/QacA subfamily drug resistance transporter